MSNEPFLESENLKNSESEKSCEPRAMSNEPFLESEKSVNISEICGNEKTNHKLVQKKSEKGSEQRAMSHEQRFRKAQSSQLEAQSLKKTVDRCPLSVDYFESQIRLADSLYKNYLPQYNFEEVKAAVMFFDSCQSSAVSRQPWRLFNKKVADENKLIADRRLLTAAKAHYYHAVGLTERDDIVGACEHYFIALEIMESEIENLKTSKSGKGSEQRAMSHEQKFRNAHSSKLEAQSTSQFFSFSDSQILNNPEDYEKIRFLSLIYTRLGELFLSENYCDLAISKYRKALRYVLLLGENKAVANTYKCLGNSYHLYDMPDSALYYYNKSLETNSELPNRLDVEKCIAQILFDRGEKDSAYVMIKNNLGKIENQEIKESYMITLGNMYYEDNVYDSAIYYLEMCENSKIYYIRITSSIKLSAIYGSEQNYEKKAYHDNVISMLSVEKANKSVVDNNIHTIYNIYKEREVEREGKMERLHMRRSFSVVLIVILIMSLFTATFLHYIHTKRNGRLSKVIESKVIDINEKENVITLITNDIKSKEKTIEENRRIIHDKERRIAEMINELETKEQELSAKKNALEKLYNDIIRQKSEIESVNIELVRNKKEIDDMKQTLSAQEEIIRKQRCELHEIEKDRKTFDMEAYHNSEICRKILERKSTEYTLLKSEELVQLLDSANTNLGGLISNLNRDYPQLNKDELYCICLLLLNFNKTSLQYMLNRGRKTIWRRIDNICKVLEITTKNDMFMSLTKVLNEKYY